MSSKNTTKKPVFKCMRCDNCCYFSKPEESPILLPHEVDMLKLLAVKLNITENLVFEKAESGLYRWVIRGYCPFYSPEKRTCRIHDVKPLACRMYPLLVNLSTMELCLSRLCKWVNQNLSTLQITSLRDVEEIFPVEIQAVYELLEILSRSESHNFVEDSGKPEVNSMSVNR